MGTDLEVGIRYELAGVRVEEGGEAILPVASLVGILRASPDEELSIEADDRRCRVNTSTSEYEMPSEDPRDFPDIPSFTDANYHEITAGDLKRMVHRTAFAAGKDDTKYALKGVLWLVEEKKARLVATDTRRLAVCTGPAVIPNKIETKGQSHLIPPKAITLLERILTEGDDNQPIQIYLRANDALFRSEKSEIYSRLGEGRYPPYQGILQDAQKKAKVKVSIAVEPFLSAIRQAAIMTDNESVRVIFQFAPGKLTLQAQGATTGKSKVEMKIDYDAEPISINFDPQYLVEMLRIVDGSEILTLDLVDGNKPALFHSGDDYLYLVMPLA
jgi:DNA polymerase-3 subunit beta